MKADELDTFWTMFVQEHWEQRPGVFPGLLPETFVSPEQAFDGVKAACARWRSNRSARIRFYVENALLQSNLDDYVPGPEDGSFLHYAKRISPMLYGQGFALVVNGFAYYDFELFRRTRRFLRGLYERVGLPGEETDLDVFFGNYRHTPFGVHKDTASNFSIVFEGRKRFLLWAAPALPDSTRFEHTTHFDEIRENALVLEASAGDVVYWPSSYWHIAESNGGFSGTLNIALYLGDCGPQFVASALGSKAARIPNPSAHTLPWDPELSRVPILPEQLERVLRSEHLPRASEREKRRAVLRAWLARTTAYNFFRSAPPTSAAHTLLLSDCVRGDVEFPIQMLEHDGRLLCAAHGHVVEARALSSVRNLIQTLNSGRVATVGDLVAQTAGPARVGGLSLNVSPENACALLESLVAIRAIRKAPG